MVDDHSGTAADMQVTADPGESGSESLPTDLGGEIERLRFALQEIKTALGIQGAEWYSSPVNNKAAFLAFNSADDVNQTGNGAVATVDFDTEIYDIGGVFATDTFTAPVAGKYHLGSVVTLSNVDVGITIMRISIVTSNRTYQRSIPLNLAGTSVISMNIDAIADMDATDTATITIAGLNGAGDTATVRGNAGTPHITYFYGARVPV